MEFRANKRIKLSSQKGPSPLDLARTYCQNYVDPPGFEVKTVDDVIDLRTARNQDKQHPYTRKKSMRRQHNDY
ncbi:hypothetical protein DPMN_095943 [Dreissena polymorpha]|uniref:Uncharacterized protein n=1 Tax=Dreissena polymorpha TaxID=45954 RepID=A0A9D4L8J0_DREPO|nr:hypothetical protein DPMN_095943 [Dreissena polymorpha]